MGEAPWIHRQVRKKKKDWGQRWQVWTFFSPACCENSSCGVPPRKKKPNRLIFIDASTLFVLGCERGDVAHNVSTMR